MVHRLRFGQHIGDKHFQLDAKAAYKSFHECAAGSPA